MSRGFDAATLGRDEDILGRWPFAAEIASLVCETPADWSTRVGVFGPWGSGKTSVLNFIRQMIQQRGHLAIGFSPWGLTDYQQMWMGLAESIANEVEART